MVPTLSPVSAFFMVQERVNTYFPNQPASACATDSAAVCAPAGFMPAVREDIWSGVKLGLRHRGCHMNTKPNSLNTTELYSEKPKLTEQQHFTHRLAAEGWSKALLMDSIKPQPVRQHSAPGTALSLLRVDPEPFWIPTGMDTFLDYS